MRILVLDDDWSQTAHLVAELSAKGFDVVLVSPRMPDRCGLGRYCRQIVAPHALDPAYPSFLEQLLKVEQSDLVFPTCEPIQFLLWNMPEEPAVRAFPATTPRQRELLADRLALYRMVSALGVLTPRMAPLDSEDDLPRAAAALRLPFVVRGTQGMSGAQVKVVRSLDEARSAYAALRAVSPNPPFAQEFLDGGRCLIGALLDHGRMLQWFSQTTIDAYPSVTGPSIRVRSLRDAVLTGHAARIFEALEWDGLACAEFIRLGPGDYRFLEVNPRPWAAIRAAHRCGVALQNSFVDYLRGERPVLGSEFADGIEVTLVPAFFSARLQAGQFPRWRDLKAYRQSLAMIPWTKPPLVRYFVQSMIWARAAAARAAGR